jgi:hypothetical protein
MIWQWRGICRWALENQPILLDLATIIISSKKYTDFASQARQAGRDLGANLGKAVTARPMSAV